MFKIFQSFGPYQLLGELGLGGMGMVYLARDPRLNRVVALKVIRPVVLASEESRRRLRVEAEAAGSLDHPHIVPVLDVGEVESEPYLAMKFIPGGSLAERIVAQPFSPEGAARLLVTVARSVAFAHQHGVLHRDLKPSNILLDDEGEPHLTDFGLAKLVNVDAGLTVSGAPLGTCGYMAPEVASEGARVATMASDIYSLGAVLYELLAGRVPYAANSYAEFLRLIDQSDPRPPWSVRESREGKSSRTSLTAKRTSKFQRDLELICLHCLNREPAKRYTSASALADDLDRLLRGEPITPRAPRLHELAAVWIRRHRFATSVAGAAVVALLLGLMATVWQLRRAERFLAESQAANSELVRTDVRLSLGDFETKSANPYRRSALHNLSLLLRRYPTNEIVATRLWSALRQRSYALRRLPPLSHVGEVNYVAFTADGNRLLTACRENDPSVQLWDLRTGRRLGRVPHEADRAPILRDWATTRLATVTASGHLHLWSLPELRELPGPWTNGIEASTATLSPSGRWLAAATPDQQLVVWNTESALLAWQTDLPAEMTALTFSADDAKLLAADAAGDVHLFSTPDGAARRDVASGIGFIEQAEASPRGETFLLIATNAIALLHGTPEPGIRFRVTLTNIPEPVARFSPDGQFIAVGTREPLIQEYSVATGALTWASEGLRGDVDSLAYAPDQLEMAYTTGDGMVRFLPRSPQTMLREPVKAGVFAWDVEFSPDGQALAVGVSDLAAHVFSLAGRFDPKPVELAETNMVRWTLSQAGDQVAVLDSQGRMGLRRLKAGSAFEPWFIPELEPRVFAFSPSGRWLVLRGGPGIARLYSAADRRTTPLRLNHDAGLFPALAFNLDESRLALATETAVHVWNLAGPEPLRETVLTNVYRTQALQFTPDGSRLVVTTVEYQAALYDTKSWERFKSLLSHHSPVHFLSFSRDGKLLATGGQDRTARVWNTSDGSPVTPYLQNGNDGSVVALSPDGRELLTGGRERSVQRWRIPGGDPDSRELVTSAYVSKIHFSPDGRWILTGGTNSAQLWDAASGVSVMDPVVFAGPLVSADFSTDGRRMLLISRAGLPSASPAPTDVEVLSLPTDDVPAVRPLLALAQLALDRSFNDRGGLETLTTESLARLYREAAPILEANHSPRSIRLRLYPAARR